VAAFFESMIGGVISAVLQCEMDSPMDIADLSVKMVQLGLEL
jgi:hypothetical protein